MSIRNIYLFGVYLLMCGFFSCSSQDYIQTDVEQGEELRLNLLSGETEDGSDYSEVFVFNGLEPKKDYFHHKVLNIQRTPQHMKMNVPEGLWNCVLVTCNEPSVGSQIITPSFSLPKAESPMWINQPVDGLLPDAPEICTALLDQIPIQADQIASRTAALTRNVAKIRVVLKSGLGFKLGDMHSFYLKNVPLGITWSGSLYPSKNSPDVSPFAMTKKVNIFASQQQGYQQSDTVDFIIPAHRSSSPTDISSHRITLGVKMITTGSSVFQKEVTIETVPKNNKTLLLNLNVKGAVEVEAKIQEWQTVSSVQTIDKAYELSLLSNDGKLATYKMSMFQERNWWVTLDDSSNFEFVDASRTFGQLTTDPVNISVRRKTSGEAKSTKLNLFVAGFDGAVEKYVVSELIQ